MPVCHFCKCNQNALVQRNPNRAGTSQQTNPNYQNYQQTYFNILENLIIENNDGRNINRTENFFNKLSQTIPPAVATEDSSLAAIFPFELEENKAMFSGATLNKKCPITAMYMEATVNNTPIKLILDSRSTGSIVMLQLVNQLGFKVDHTATSQIITANGSTKLPHGKINSFSFEVNDIKDTENGIKNCVLLVENHYQEGATETTYQAEEEHMMQLANTQSSSVTG
ncbi:hypothetical protein G9A89_004855 [Geosiphon pyriformis]|nr:hypothetical protein G9A89_004855 [Geosiphon pyriformis]